jgi:hypothetical protein
LATNNFGSDQNNSSLINITSYLDETGVLRIQNESISSYNFDGVVPAAVGNVAASAILPGMKISLTGSTDAVTYFSVTATDNEEDILTGSSLGITVIKYLDEGGLDRTIAVGSSAFFPVVYEDWENKYLGETGWFLSNQGNAIFSNVAVRGRVEATEGTLENIIAQSGNIQQLSIGSGKTHDFVNIVGTASVTDASHSGQFILTMDEDYTIRKFSPGDHFYVNSTSAVSGIAFVDGFPETASVFFNTVSITKDGFWNSPYKFVVITASYQEYIGTNFYNRYFCEISQSGLTLNYDFSQVTASFGQINVGYLYFGEFNVFNSTGGLQIDGLIFNTIGPKSFTSGYVPDYIDLSGRFRLGGGKLIFDGETLTVDAQLTVGDLSASYASYDFISASYADLSSLATSGATIINGSNIITGTISAARIQSGVFVSGTQLSSSGQTIINGSNITTGTISADRIDVDNLTVKKLQTGINNLNQRILINDATAGSDPSIIFTTETGNNKFFIYYDYLNGLQISSNPLGTNDTRSVEFDLDGGNIELSGGGTFVGDGSGLTNIAAGNAYKNATTSPTPANKVTFGTGAPPASGRTTGDIHLRYT